MGVPLLVRLAVVRDVDLAADDRLEISRGYRGGYARLLTPFTSRFAAPFSGHSSREQ